MIEPQVQKKGYIKQEIELQVQKIMIDFFLWRDIYLIFEKKNEWFYEETHGRFLKKKNHSKNVKLTRPLFKKIKNKHSKNIEERKWNIW